MSCAGEQAVLRDLRRAIVVREEERGPGVTHMEASGCATGAAGSVAAMLLVACTRHVAGRADSVAHMRMSVRLCTVWLCMHPRVCLPTFGARLARYCLQLRTFCCVRAGMRVHIQTAWKCEHALAPCVHVALHWSSKAGAWLSLCGRVYSLRRTRNARLLRPASHAQVLLANKVKVLWGHKLHKTWLTQQRDMRDPHRMQVAFRMDKSVSTPKDN